MHTLEAPAAAPAPTGHAGRGDRRWDVLLVLAVAVQAAALTAWPRVVTVDGPAHLASAWALLHSADPTYTVYRVDLGPVPNLLSTLLLAALLTVLGPDSAERVLVLAYAVGLPLALRYALRGVDPRAGWLAVAAVPFVGGYLLTYGFYNLCLALVGMLVVLGLALRQRAGWSLRAALFAALLLALTWGAHLVPLLVAGLFVTVLAGARAHADRAAGTGAALRRHVLPPALIGLPVLALTLVFVLQSADSRGEPVRASSPLSLLAGLLTLGRPLVAWTRWEYAGSVLVAIALITLAVLRGRDSRRLPERSALAVTGLLLTLWYLASPDRYGPEYGFLNDRLSLFPPLMLILWAAAPPPSGRAGRLALLALLAGTVALIGVRLPTDLHFQRDVAEMLSIAPAVPPGSTLVALRLSRDEPVGPEARNRARDPLRHLAGRIAVLRDGVDVGHYQAVSPSFAVRFRDDVDPRRAIDPDLSGLVLVPPRVDLTRGPAVVLVVGRASATAEDLSRPQTRALLQQLESSYRLAATSRRSGLVEVWQRR